MIDSDKNDFEDLNERLGECEVCGQNAIYTCPKCELKTCSLKCVKIHKIELDCDGVRCKTKYIPVKKFTNLDLLSDYRLLEDASRIASNNKKIIFAKDAQKELPINLVRLRGAAYRRDTLLMFLPKEFTRHKENSTYLNWKTQIIFWHIEFVFVDADNLKLSSKECLETQKIGLVLNHYFNPSNFENKNINEKLKFYHSAGINNIRILLRAERVPGKKFYELELNKSICECLKKRIIIEYPIIYVVLKTNFEIHGFNIIEPENELENNHQSKQINKNNEHQKLNSNQDGVIKFNKSNKRTNKNLLFVMENSSDEDLSSDDEKNIKIPKRC